VRSAHTLGRWRDDGNSSSIPRAPVRNPLRVGGFPVTGDVA